MRSEVAIEVIEDRRYLGLRPGLPFAGSTVLVQPREQLPELGRLERTLFGILAPSLVSHLGIETQLFDAIAPQLSPRCSACGILAQSPGTLDPARLPSDGFLAAVLHDDRQDIPLQERCELLGSERALVGQHLVRIDECSAEDGEPVLALMSASSADDFKAAISLWLARGSACVRVMHLAERLAPARELARLSPSWTCGGCGKLFERVSKSAVLSAPPCARCRGEGWLEVDDKRVTACEACGGFGGSTGLARYEWRGVALCHLAGVTLKTLREGLASESAVSKALDVVMRHGFADYPLGGPIGTMSLGERARLSMACVELSQVEGITLVADAASLFSGNAESGAEGAQLFMPEVAQPPRAMKRSAAGGESVCVREIEFGPLAVGELSFPIGTSIALQGPSGSGKSTLLREVARIFSKRKKLANRCSFPGLKSCTLVDTQSPPPELIGDLVGVMALVADELAGTRMARERGLGVREVSLSTSPLRCAACAESESGESCSECGGAEIDAAAGSLLFGKLRWSEILHAPLADIGNLRWRSTVVPAIISALPADLASRVTLATRCSSLTGAERRALQVCAGLGRVLSARKGPQPASLETDLVLLDTPFCLAREHQVAVWRMLGELNDRGATVLCAGVPEALESSFGSVVRLRPSVEAAPTRVQHRMYDVRHARAVGLDIVK